MLYEIKIDTSIPESINLNINGQKLNIPHKEINKNTSIDNLTKNTFIINRTNIKELEVTNDKTSIYDVGTIVKYNTLKTKLLINESFIIDTFTGDSYIIKVDSFDYNSVTFLLHGDCITLSLEDINTVYEITSIVPHIKL